MFLCVDHVNNDGAEHRKKTGSSGSQICVWLVNEGFPDGFQILCYNCNFAKHLNGGTCPHGAE